MTTIGPYELDTVHCADALDWLRTLPDGCVNCIVTSPPYFGLRDYGVDGQLGLEPTLRDYIDRLTAVFSEARRVLRDDGVAWVNMGDSYNGGGNYRGINSEETLSAKQRSNGGARGVSPLLGVKETGVPDKSLLGVPWRLAFALQDAGWILRSDCIWHKPNPMPESVTDRPTKAHEYVFLLSKMRRYWYDAKAIREPNAGIMPYGNKRGFKMNSDAAQGRHGKTSMFAGGTKDEYTEKCYTNGRNARTVWTIATEPTPFAHFATFPRALVRRCVLAGCPIDGVVLDPFMGSGTTALVARSLGRHYIGCDLNPEYVALAQRRLTEPYTLALPIDAGGN